MVCRRALGIGDRPGAPLSSAVTISENARPIQSAEGSEPRFSKRRTAMRSREGRAGCRWHAERKAKARMVRAKSRRLQNTRLQREQVLELFRVSQRRELRIGLQLFSLLET